VADGLFAPASGAPTEGGVSANAGCRRDPAPAAGGEGSCGGRPQFREVAKEVPFEIKRYFLVYGVPSEDIRGEHAPPLAAPVSGLSPRALPCVADDGAPIARSSSWISPATGLQPGSMVWGIQYKYSADAVLLVLASGSIQTRTATFGVLGVPPAGEGVKYSLDHSGLQERGEPRSIAPRGW